MQQVPLTLQSCLLEISDLDARSCDVNWREQICNFLKRSEELLTAEGLCNAVRDDLSISVPERGLKAILDDAAFDIRFQTLLEHAPEIFRNIDGDGLVRAGRSY